MGILIALSVSRFDANFNFPVRISHNIRRSLLATVNDTPMELSSVSSIKRTGVSSCNIFHNSLTSLVPIPRKYLNTDIGHSLYPSISMCNLKI